MRYSIEIDSDDGNHRTFILGVEEQSGRGWAKMRVLEIRDTHPRASVIYSSENTLPEAIG